MKNCKYLLVASGGGHLKELYEALPKSFNFNISVLLTYQTKTISKANKNVNFIVNPHKSIFKYFLCFVQTLYYFLRYRPKCVISTGAGIAIPSIILAKVFGAQLFFIETAANLHKPSKTGNFAYKRADLFIVQYKKLQEYYPNARIGRLL